MAMYLNEQKQQFSLAYIRAVAATASYKVAIPESDTDSVDGALMSDIGRRPRIEFQAKSTARDILGNDALRYELPIKNYDELRADVLTPRILVVVLMPDEKQDWISQTQDEMCLRYCGYWLSLRGEQPRLNTSSVTVRIPTTNIFNTDELTGLMQKAERGDAL